MEQHPVARLSFDPSFAGPADWASMYRGHGLQVVPAHLPRPGTQWKRPAVREWKQFQKELLPEAAFLRWYGPGGLYVSHTNMGLITGYASNNIFVLDLDTYKGPAAMEWWQAQLHLNNYGEIPHCWRSRTGGGGQHLFFRAPDGWLVPNNATQLGVDIKGQGGFVVLPPSLHISGNHYAWEAGYGPHEAGELEEAPQWLLDALDAVAESYGGHKEEPRGDEPVQTPSPSEEQNAFGKRIDGREKEMRDIVYHGGLELRRLTSQPTGAQIEQFRQLALSRYYQSTSTRLTSVDNIAGLEIEGRGETLFNAKWDRMMRKWGSPEIEQAAARPNPKTAPLEPLDTRLEDAFKAVDAAPDAGIEMLDVREVKALAPPRWLIEGLIAEQGLGFIFGPPGSGKSFIALSQALSLATARESWWGRPVNRPGAVIYVSSEGHTDFKFRIMAWEAQNGVLADDAPFFLIRVPLNLMRADDVARLIRALEAAVARAGVQVTAVFIDTVSRVMPGADENLQKDMTLFVAACDQIRMRFQPTVCGVHHTSRAGNLRGSTVFDGAGDFLIQIEKEEGAARGTMTATKIKAAPDGWKEPFALVKHELALGHSSLVAVKGTPPPPVSAVWPEKNVCQDILKAIGEAWNAKRPWSPKPQTRGEGRYAARQIEVTFGVAEKTAEQMVTAWLENRVLAYELIDTRMKRYGLKVVGWID